MGVDNCDLLDVLMLIHLRTMAQISNDPVEVRKLIIRIRLIKAFLKKHRQGKEWKSLFSAFDHRFRDGALASRIHSRFQGRRKPIPETDNWWIESMESIKSHVEAYQRP